MSSRIYHGDWLVRVVFEQDGEDVLDYSPPMRYEDAEGLCLLFAIGHPYPFGLQGVRVKRARIVPAAEAA